MGRLSTACPEVVSSRTHRTIAYDAAPGRTSTRTTSPERRPVEGSECTDERAAGFQERRTRIPGPREPHRAVARAATIGGGRTGGARRPDAGARGVRPRRAPAGRRRLLPPRPPADLPRDPRAGREEPPLRRGDAGRMV